MTGQIIALICMLLVTGGVTAGIFQAVKKYVPESNNLRRICAYVVALMIGLATSYLAGDVWGIIGSGSDGTLTAQTMFAYVTGIWAVAEGVYRVWYRPAESPGDGWTL